MERLSISKVSISNGSKEQFKRQIYCEKWCSYRVFYVTIANADIGSLKSLHTLFKVFEPHAGKIWTKSYGSNYTNFLSFLPKKMVDHFWRVDAILEDISVTETIVWCQIIDLKTIIIQCSKHYSSPTRVTRLNVALNMADPISLDEKRP